MRYQELLFMGGKSDIVRYNSELGFLLGLPGVGLNMKKFNIKKLSNHINPKSVVNIEAILRDSKKLVEPNFEPNKFNHFYNIAQKFWPLIASKLNQEGDSVPKVFDWAGGTNKSDNDAVDIVFSGSNNMGISIKDDGGITLKNASPKDIGLETIQGEDVFQSYAREEYNEWKRKTFVDLLNDARKSPGTVLAFDKSKKYSIQFDSGTKKFNIQGKGKSGSYTADEIMNNHTKTSPLFRVFGDYFQANYQSKKHYMKPMVDKIKVQFQSIIEKTFEDSAKVKGWVRMAGRPYFYMTPKSLYYVPSADDIDDITATMKYAEPDGTAQLFRLELRQPNSKGVATLDLYIRWANGLFAANSTVRLQTLKDPENISWQKLA